MQQYTFTIPDNLQANELLNFILRTNIFTVNSSSISSKKKEQAEMFTNDMKESFAEIEQMEQGKKSKETLKEFLNEF